MCWFIISYVAKYKKSTGVWERSFWQCQASVEEWQVVDLAGARSLSSQLNYFMEGLGLLRSEAFD